MLCAASELPLASLVALAAASSEVTSTEGPLRTASRSIALPLTLSEAVQRRATPRLAEGGNAPASGPVLHVRLHYSVAACAGSTGADVSALVCASTAAHAQVDGRSPAAAALATGNHWSIIGGDVEGSAFIDLGDFLSYCFTFHHPKNICKTATMQQIALAHTCFVVL